MTDAQRTARIERKTRETEIVVDLDLDGTGEAEIRTGIGFLDHMLTTLARHSRIDLKLTCRGDLDVDGHHTSEDCALDCDSRGVAIDCDRRGSGGFRHTA